jgi:hypothetical protein
MTDTKAFCTTCICNVGLDDSSPEAKISVAARRHSEKNEMLIGEDGHCFYCGKSGLVVYYMIPESTE